MSDSAATPASLLLRLDLAARLLDEAAGELRDLSPVQPGMPSRIEQILGVETTALHRSIAERKIARLGRGDQA